MKHKTDIDGGYKKLAEDLGDLTYDSLGDFLLLLSNKILKDARADEGRQRMKLAEQLNLAGIHIQTAWKICKPYMVEK